MLKAKKIRLDVSEQDAATLEFMQGKCRGLYNWLVMRLRAGERWHFRERFAFPAWATHGRSRAVCGCVHRN